jgi:hypothetical protein
MKRKQFIHSSGAALLGTLLLRNSSLDRFAMQPKEARMV